MSCSQAIQLILQYAPVLTVEYCLTYLPPQLDHWRDLLASLLDICTSHDQQGSSANPQLVEIHRSLYKGRVKSNNYCGTHLVYNCQSQLHHHYHSYRGRS